MYLYLSAHVLSRGKSHEACLRNDFKPRKNKNTKKANYSVIIANNNDRVSFNKNERSQKVAVVGG